MANEKPQVIDKRRFADRADDDDDRKEAQSMFLPEGPLEFRSNHLDLSYSPSSNPANTPGMDFPKAMQQVMKGHRVTRLEWENPEIWLLMFYWGAINPKTPAGKYLTIHHADGAMNPLYISDGDLFGDDWVIVV